MCKWMLFLSTGNIQQNYCFFSKDFWELSILSDMRTRTEYLPCDWVFYRKFIKDCLILLSSLCSQSNKWVSRFQLLLGFVGCFFMDSTGLSILALGLSEMARSIDRSVWGAGWGSWSLLWLLPLLPSPSRQCRRPLGPWPVPEAHQVSIPLWGTLRLGRMPLQLLSTQAKARLCHFIAVFHGADTQRKS